MSASKASRPRFLSVKHLRLRSRHMLHQDAAIESAAVEADSISNLRSELGHQLAKRSQFLNLRGIGAVVYKVPELNNDQMLKISLRSVELEDTTPISQKYGGGGHRNAGSFMLSLSEFESWKVQTKPSD